MKIKVLPKNNAASNSIKKTGDVFDVIKLQRHVNFSDKTDWFLCKSNSRMFGNVEFFVHPKEDPNFIVIGGST